MSCARLPSEDLEHVLSHTRDLWEEVRGQRMFITGGTGFFGVWLLETFLHANDQLGLNAQAVVLSRAPDRFAVKAPHLAEHPALAFHRGDVRDFTFPEGRFSHVIHAATESSTNLNSEAPLLMLDAIVLGTRRTLDFAAQCGARKFLFTSSGAVYGRQPPELTHVPEDYLGAPDPTDPRSAYGEGKRMAELLAVLYARQHGFEAKIARGFAFVGPHLPLDVHFAIGNFIRDALRGGPIVVQGDGTPYRSYLYAADLAIWLWTILFRGQSGRPYNVGSDDSRTIADLAVAVGEAWPPAAQVRIGATPVPGTPPSRYVPSVDRARRELGLQPRIGLLDAIRKTASWYSATSACVT
jgi:dTDP-glucose 4,6-dehydratase